MISETNNRLNLNGKGKYKKTNVQQFVKKLCNFAT